MRRARRGVTTIELLVVLAVLGVIAGVAGLSLRAVRAERSTAVVALDRIASTRREAIAARRRISTVIAMDNGPHAVTAYPDGRVLVDSLELVDALSGRAARADEEVADARP